MINLKPNPDCKICHGTGEVIDWVPMPFGQGNCALPSECECCFEITQCTKEEWERIDAGEEFKIG